MSRSPHANSPTRSLRRPLGLTLLTGYDVLLVALLPALVAIVDFFGTAPVARPPTYQILATLLLSGAVLWAASGTRSGESGMRYGLVVLVTLYYVGVMFGTPYTVDPAGVLYMSAGDVNPTMEQVLRIGRSLFWILLHGWYLLGGPTEDFFEARARQLSALQE